MSSLETDKLIYFKDILFQVVQNENSLKRIQIKCGMLQTFE